jgi:hypothetical protein
MSKNNTYKSIKKGSLWISPHLSLWEKKVDVENYWKMFKKA